MLPPKGTRSRELIDGLGLEYLPGESGFFKFLGRSAETVSIDGRVLSLQSRIYYLLTTECPVNHLHWLASEDTHFLIEGGPVDYYLFLPGGELQTCTLGRDVRRGQVCSVSVPANSWKALRLHPETEYVLLGNALSPEWTPDRVRIGADAEWIRRHEGKAPWATEAFLKFLIGPNRTD